MKWSINQQDAINTRGKNILVSAAAGSGKTAVLTQRIVDIIIKEKISIDSMLILTFTKAAANEMKSRIQSRLYKYLQENGKDIHIKNQIGLIGQANISTMHAFCVGLLRENFEVLDIDPNFTLGNNSVISILKDEAIQEIFEEKYESQDEDFLNLVNIYSKKNDDSYLINIIYQIYTFIQSKKEPIKWLYEQAEKYNIKNINDSEYMSVMKKDIRLNIESLKSIIQNAIDLCKNANLKYEETLIQDMENLIYLEQILQKDYDLFIKEVSQLKYPKLKSIRKNEDVDMSVVEKVKNIRDYHIKKYGFEELKKHNINTSIYAKQMKDYYPVILSLCKLVEEFKSRYMAAKLEKNIFDFNDLEHQTLKILNDEDCANKLKQKYKYIFYDEYQDSNEVQDTIIQKIASKDNLFFVGDVKQSIYRFRLAEPQIFIDKYELYKTDKNSKKIDLSENFRSSSRVIDFCNMIFEKIMTKDVAGIEYDDSARLKYHKKKYKKNYEIIKNKKLTSENIKFKLYPKSSVKINILTNIEEKNKYSDYEKENDIDISDFEDEELMAELTAKQIIDMINSKKNINYRDIIILKRSLKGSVNIYSRVFKKHNIPLFIDYSQAVFEVLEVSLFIDFLKIIDNIRQDEALLAVLLSSIGKFDIDDITKIKIYDMKEKYFYNIFFKYAREVQDELSEKIAKFIKKIENYADIERYMQLDEFIDYIMTDSSYKDYISTMPQGEMRIQNLEIINEKAREFIQNENKSLFHFLMYIDAILKNKSDDITPKSISKEQNLVRLMSIHKSKGLESRIVIINDLQKKFNMQDKNKAILLDAKYGIGSNYVDIQDDYYMPTLAKKAVLSEYESGARAEEIRILYVALTRAKNDIILNSIGKATYYKLIENIRTGFFPKGLESINNYQDFILYAIADDIRDNFSNTKLYQFNEIDIKDIILAEEEKTDLRQKFEDMLKNISLSEEEKKLIREKYTYDYEYKDYITKQVKTSVTSLAKKNIELKSKYIVEKLFDYDYHKKINDFTPEKIGTLNHLFLQHIDFKKDYTSDDLEKQLADMIKSDFITQEESEVINLKQVYNFIKSDIGKRIKKSQNIYQEESFIDSYDGTLLSGVIDLFFEEDNHLVLLDYKTDSVRKEDVKEHAKMYKEQINLYKTAINKAFDKEVKQSYIYFLSVGEIVEI